MFDIGWSEMAVIALVALVVLGPKELPGALRAAAKWARKARSLAREFQSGVDDLIREADLDDARKAVQAVKSLDMDKVIGETVDPTGSVGDEVRAIDRAARDDDTAPAGEGAAAVEAPEPNIAPPHSLPPPAAAAKPEPAAKPALATEEAGKTA